MFGDQRFARLGLRHVRYITPWDTLHDPVALERLDTWMAAARRHRAHVLLGFAHSLRSERLARTLPTRRRFRREFRRIRARYPDVRAFIAWSEANHPGALTWKRPGRAAQFFDVVASHCDGCQIVAADVLDVPNMAAWVRRFQRAARHRPRIWGLHNYGDANGLTTSGTRTLLAITRGRIWFTETGGVVLRRRYRGARVLNTYRYSLKHAAEATRHVLRLSCLSRRIRRIYLYHWQAPRAGDELGLGAARPPRPRPPRVPHAPAPARRRLVATAARPLHERRAGLGDDLVARPRPTPRVEDLDLDRRRRSPPPRPPRASAAVDHARRPSCRGRASRSGLGHPVARPGSEDRRPGARDLRVRRRVPPDVVGVDDDADLLRGERARRGRAPGRA